MVMENKLKFKEYLKSVRKLSASTISKYSEQASNRILKDLGVNIYEIESMEKLHQLLRDVKLLEQQMLKDPRRMYSAAVSNYIKFKAYQLENQYLIEESLYLYSIEKELMANEVEQEDEPVIRPKAPAMLKEHSVQLYKRDKKVAVQSIKDNHFLCQININHRWFKSSATHENYVEAHHIIPISTQALFEYSIDCVPNIASLCPVCHRQIHYDYKENKVKLLEILWNQNKEGIERAGINIKFNELVELY